MSLPGEPKEEFLLLQPFSPLKKQNMSAWLAARMDEGHYGDLVLYNFPKENLVYGPAQIETFISQDPAISAQLTLWDQSGSSVIRGNLLVIPIEDAVLYAEPLYLQADQSSIPSMKRVIVSFGGHVVMEPTLGAALDKLFGPGASGSTTTTTPGSTPTTTPTTTPGSTTTTTPGQTTTTTTVGAPLPTDRASLTALASQLYEQALTAQRAGNWSEYGRLIGELGQVITALQTAK
jgi:uncharacterized protein